MVYKLKEDFKELEIIINGGITSPIQAKDHLTKVDGVMIGRSVYHSPYMLADIEKEIFQKEVSYFYSIRKEREAFLNLNEEIRCVF